MKNNGIIFWIALGTILLIIAIPTILKVSNNHKQKLFDAEIAKIKDKAQICILEEFCVNDKIYLKDLYYYGYIKEKVINPITKEYFDEESYLIKKEEDFEVNFN